jgi:tetraacyldisaccharide 4'-kinase
MWSMRRSVEIPAAARRAVAFCGIARPEEFFLALQQAGLELPASRAFSDHQRYTRRDIDSLIRIARQIDADSFITTEKDAVKLNASLRQRLEQTALLHVVRLQMTLLDEAEVIADLIRQIGSGVIRPLGQTRRSL